MFTTNADIITTILLSLKVAAIATTINLFGALWVATLLSKKHFPGKDLIDGIINLPLVMPPVTTGYLLLLLFGKKGVFGSVLFSLFHLRIAFTGLAAIFASMVVSFPLITRSIRISMEMVDPKLKKAALTLGANKFQVFLRITLPLMLPGVLNGIVLGFARSIGEFGATVTFAGNIEGISRTIPLSVYTLLQIPGKENEAAILVVVSIIISFTAMFASSRFQRKTQKRNEKARGVPNES